MKTYDAVLGKVNFLNKTGTNDTRRLRFDVKEWRTSYPNGVIQLVHRRPWDVKGLPVSGFTVEGNEAFWLISDADTHYPGQGEAELVLTNNGDEIDKSPTYLTKIEPSVGDQEAEPPEPYQGWVDEVLAVPGKMPYVDEGTGHWMKWDTSVNHFVDTGVDARGVPPQAMTTAEIDEAMQH